MPTKTTDSDLMDEFSATPYDLATTARSGRNIHGGIRMQTENIKWEIHLAAGGKCRYDPASGRSHMADGLLSNVVDGGNQAADFLTPSS